MKRHTKIEKICALLASMAVVTAGCGGAGVRGADPDTTPESDIGDYAYPQQNAENATLENQVQDRRIQGTTFHSPSPVGSIPGAATVDGMGNATYAVPIAAPQGANGLTPEISISYNSGRGVGLAGMGFTIDGFGSTIERCAKTGGTDGEFERVQFDEDDAFCFGGRPMVLVSGTHGETGAEYRTRRDPFDKILLTQEPGGSDGGSWEVWLQDGRIIRYGPQDPGFQLGEPVAAWRASTVSDRYGNHLTYHWHVEERSVRPERITYANGQSIEFTFFDLREDFSESIAEVRSGYEGGRRYERPWLLRQVDVVGGDSTLLWSYSFAYDYEPGTQTHMLDSIQQCTAQGECLPATSFKWGQVDEDGNPNVPVGLAYFHGTVNEYDTIDAPPEIIQGLVYGASRALDLDGNGQDEVLTTNFHGDFPILLGELPGMPGSSEGMAYARDPVEVHPFNGSGFPQNEDPTPAEASIRDANRVEQFARLLHKFSTFCIPAGGPPHALETCDTFTYEQFDELAQEVADHEAAFGEIEPSDIGDSPLVSTQMPGMFEAPPPIPSFGANLFGGAADTLLYPVSPRVFGDSDVSANDTPLAGMFVAAFNASFDAATEVVGMENASFDPGGDVFAVYPVDHDGNGLTDLWMCRGGDGRDGEWVLGVNEGDDPGAGFLSNPSGDSDAMPWNGAQLAMSVHPTGVRCSAWDEVLLIPRAGTTRTELYVVPTYDQSGSLDPIEDDERLVYERLIYEVGSASGSYEPSNLPRDRFQRWHDKGCRNAYADAMVGFPAFGGGGGADRIIDVDGDGNMDVVRFELAGGDEPDNLDSIADGMSASWLYRDSCTSTQHAYSYVRWYRNDGTGNFYAGVTNTIAAFDGIPHADYWLTWRGAAVLDINADNRADFLLPRDDDPSSDQFEVHYSRPDGTYAVTTMDTTGGWPRYEDDATWHDELDRLGAVRFLNVNDARDLLLLGDWTPDSNEDNVYAAEFFSAGVWPRVVDIENGLGANDRFHYRVVQSGDGSVQRPASKFTAPKVVVGSHWQEVGPNGQMREHEYAFVGPVQDDSHGRLLGYESVTVQTRYGDGQSIEPVVSTTRREYDFEYDASIGDFPHARDPVLVEKVVTVPNQSGEPERHVTCDVVDEWDVLTPNAGNTWFSYPAVSRNLSYASATSSPSCEDLLSDGPGHPEPDVVSQTDVVMTEEGGLLSRVVDAAGLTRTTTKGADFVNDADNWFMGRAQTRVVTNCELPGTTASGTEECVNRLELIGYDAEHAEIDLTVRQPSDPNLTLTTAYERNETHGRVTSTTVTDTNGASRSTHTQWDAQGIHPEQSTNALGHPSFKLHDPATGVLYAEVDANGLTVETEYDRFLRPVRTFRRENPIVSPSPADTTISYEDPDGPADPNDPEAHDVALRIVTSQFPGGQVTVVDVGPTGKTMHEQWIGVGEPTDPSASTWTYEIVPVEVFHEYDERGRLAAKSEPTWAGEEPDTWTRWTYDDLGRKRSSTLVEIVEGEQTALQQSKRWHYLTWPIAEQRTVETFVDQDGRSTQRTMDALGRIYRAENGEGAPTRFYYGAFGDVTGVARGGETLATAPATTEYGYDAMGRQTSETSSETGTTTVFYSPFGEPELLQRPEGDAVFAFDDLGRAITRVDEDGYAAWTYDTERIGALTRSESADGIDRAYTYDSWGRVATETTAVAQGDFTVEYAYDDHDRVTQVTYPEPGYAVFHEYDTFGYHRRSRSQRAPCSLAEAAVDWEWLEADPSGNVVLERAGNGVQTERRYERGTFRPERITAHGSADSSTPLQDLVYTWSEAGDLDTRENALTGQLESFDYDGVHRLTQWEYGGSTFSVQYDGQGNITAKGGQSYAYEASTNRLQSVGGSTYQYDGQGNVLDDGARTLTWTALDKVRSLQAGGDAWSLLYDADGNRVARHVQLANEATYTFSPSYELRFDGSSLTEARISIMGATGRVVAEVFAERTELAANDTWEQRKKYVHDDHLGSPSVVTDRAGAVESNVMYGPWGQARDGENWFLSMSEAELEELPIGYTGHQPELDGGLINMRGRMYDPVVGRFLSADPVVENALELETWNAYSYVLNRPLSLTDPTGLQAHDPSTGEDEISSDSGTTAAAAIRTWRWRTPSWRRRCCGPAALALGAHSGS